MWRMLRSVRRRRRICSLKGLAMNNDDYLDLLEQVDAKASGLTPWEIEFVEDVLETRPLLSERQQHIIERLYDHNVMGNRHV